jgi:hypothetical protein
MQWFINFFDLVDHILDHDVDHEVVLLVPHHIEDDIFFLSTGSCRKNHVVVDHVVDDLLFFMARS